MKILTYTLFGDAELYTLGMVANARLAPLVYPGWRVRVYLGAGVPPEAVRVLERRGVEIVDRSARRLRAPWEPLLWRFEPAGDHALACIAVRDADSRIGARERAAVAQWEASGAMFHVMRDHPQHGVPMLAGMWGCRGGSLPGISAAIESWDPRDGGKGTDQKFLAERVWPLVRPDCFAHDSWERHRVFDPMAFGRHFVRDFPPVDPDDEDGLMHAAEVLGGDECDRQEVAEQRRRDEETERRSG